MQKVRHKIANSKLLEHIRDAHEYQPDDSSQQAITMGSSFFAPVEGQDSDSLSDNFDRLYGTDDSNNSDSEHSVKQSNSESDQSDSDNQSDVSQTQQEFNSDESEAAPFTDDSE